MCCFQTPYVFFSLSSFPNAPLFPANISIDDNRRLDKCAQPLFSSQHLLTSLHPPARLWPLVNRFQESGRAGRHVRQFARALPLNSKSTLFLMLAPDTCLSLAAHRRRHAVLGQTLTRTDADLEACRTTGKVCSAIALIICPC